MEGWIALISSALDCEEGSKKQSGVRSGASPRDGGGAEQRRAEGSAAHAWSFAESGDIR
jgi:hypothetical protein